MFTYFSFFDSSIFDFLGRRNNELGRRDNMFANLLTPFFFLSFPSLLTTTLTRHAYFCGATMAFGSSLPRQRYNRQSPERKKEERRKGKGTMPVSQPFHLHRKLKSPCLPSAFVDSFDRVTWFIRVLFLFLCSLFPSPARKENVTHTLSQPLDFAALLHHPLFSFLSFFYILILFFFFSFFFLLDDMDPGLKISTHRLLSEKK